jgi:hypothetical protein
MDIQNEQRIVPSNGFLMAYKHEPAASKTFSVISYITTAKKHHRQRQNRSSEHISPSKDISSNVLAIHAYARVFHYTLYTAIVDVISLWISIE